MTFLDHSFHSFVILFVPFIYSSDNCLILFSSVRSSKSNSHPAWPTTDPPPAAPTFSDHTGPGYWTFTFWAITAISKAITALCCFSFRKVSIGQFTKMYTTPLIFFHFHYFRRQIFKENIWSLSLSVYIWVCNNDSTEIDHKDWKK